MRARIALDAQILPLAQHRLVLGMERGAAAGAAQDLGDALVVLDEERAGGGAHEHLDAGGARQALQLRHVASTFSCVPPTQKAKSQCMR